MMQNAVVYVVDDDKAVREAITDIVFDMGLKSQGYPSAEDFLNSYNPQYPGCLVLDVRMAGMSGIDLLKKITADNLCLPVIIVTGHGDIQMAVEALKIGAVDFVEKPFREQALWEKIKKALEIGDCKKKIQDESKSVLDRLNLLNEKEKRVLRALLEGKNDKQIALESDVTRRAVAFQRAGIMAKMQVSNIVELTHILSRLNIAV